MLRLLRPLLVSLLLIAPAAFADALYQVELIVFRQAEKPVNASQPSPEDWANGSATIAAENQRGIALNGEAEKLAAKGYQVLLHQAWQQNVGSSPAPLRFSAGKEHDGHFPVEGVLSLAQGRQVELKLQSWVNRFGQDGFLASSERLQAQRNLLPGQLTYLDHPSIGALIRISPL